MVRLRFGRLRYATLVQRKLCLGATAGKTVPDS